MFAHFETMIFTLILILLPVFVSHSVRARVCKRCAILCESECLFSVEADMRKKQFPWLPALLVSHMVTHWCKVWLWSIHCHCYVATRSSIIRTCRVNRPIQSCTSKCWLVPKKLTWTNMTGILAGGRCKANWESSYWNVMSDCLFTTRWHHSTICLYINWFFFKIRNISLV